MNNQVEETEKNERHVALVKDVVVTKLLGKIEVEGAKVVGTPAGNSTRWIFDIEGVGGKEITIKLISHHGNKTYTSDLMSATLTPLSDAFYDARPYFSFNDDDTITIHSRSTDEPFQFSVTIDAMGSQNR